MTCDRGAERVRDTSLSGVTRRGPEDARLVLTSRLRRKHSIAGRCAQQPRFWLVQRNPLAAAREAETVPANEHRSAWGRGGPACGLM